MPALLDVRTLILVITLVFFCRAALLAYVWVINRDYAPVRLWAIGSAMTAFGVLLIGMRDAIPLVVSIAFGQTLLICGWMVIAGGIVTAAGRRPPWRAGSLVAAAGLAAMAWFLFVTPDYGLRTLAVSLPGTVFDLYAVYCCYAFRGSPRLRLSLRILGAAIAVGVVSGAAKNLHVMHAGTAAIFEATPAVLQYFLISLALVVVCTVLYVLLAAQELQDRLDAEIAERERREDSMRLADLVYRNTSEAMMVTEVDGSILTVNPAFTALTGYTEDEVRGRNPRLLKSGRQDLAFYQAMWRALLQTGKWNGDLWNRHKDGRLFAEHLSINTIRDADGRAQRYVALFHDVTQEKLSAETIFHQANHDRLTGLPNRYFFFDRLASELSRARRTGSRVGLLFMDLNRFKPINDTLGHEAGDIVLKAAADRWSASLRATDTLARLGGDEFALIVGDLGTASEAMAVAQKIIHALDVEIPLPGGKAVTVSTSVGIALFPDNAMEMDSLVAAADAAMYQSKAAGEGRYAQSGLVAEAAAAEGEWVVFDHSHLIGVERLDEQHRHLVGMINEINRTLRRDYSEAELKRQFGELIAYAAEHFRTEEAMMLEHGFPEREAHAGQHVQLLEELRRIAERFEPGDELRLLQTSKDWLLGHIMHADKALGAFLGARGAS